jgi:hypothetical protein
LELALESDQCASRDYKLSNLADPSQGIFRELSIEIQELNLQILKVITLLPMV